MSEPMKELCVVHLVRAQNGIEPFRRFLESYRVNSGAIEHDLLVVFKGFARQQDTEEYLGMLTPFCHISFYVPDKGFDITAYFAVVMHYSEHYRYFCFLNSYSVILDHEWLKKLHKNITRQDVGLVGASGSWGSRLPLNKYFSLPPLASPKKRRPLYKKLLLPWLMFPFRVAHNIHHRIYFVSFPNYHIRTNAFMISGKLMKTLNCQPIKTKRDAYRFESGRKGLTKQVLDMGKEIFVVGKDGSGYEMKEWSESKTFWKYEQENLLVADNQTCDYQDGSPERRRYLTAFAWGDDTAENVKK